MKRFAGSLGSAVFLAASARSAVAENQAQKPLPVLAADPSPISTSVSGALGPSPTPGASSSAQQLYAHVLRGVVAVERNGSPLAIGTVLGGDGRILTSLSGLGGLNRADVRYSDGTTVHARLGHMDRVSDLALLVPESGKWLEGLAASEAEPVGASLHAMLPVRGARLAPAQVDATRRVDAHSRDGEPLRQMLDIDLKGGPPIAGTPLLDESGSVVAVLVRVCKGAAAPSAAPWAAWASAAMPPSKSAAPCTPIVLGSPVSAIRSFLAEIPAQPVAPAAWLGIRGEPQTTGPAHGVRVAAIAASSPAEKAGLKAAELIVAVDGHAIDTPDRLAGSIAKHSPGESVTLLVLGGDKFREVTVPLQAAP
ncbi:MAG: PDZ domain-containing protein [Myxococcota bacterium]|nr:PDZ domain-containing protein [Myxococcota bacterium]